MAKGTKAFSPLKEALCLSHIFFPPEPQIITWGSNLLSPCRRLCSYAHRADILRLWALFNILIVVLLFSFCCWEGFQWVLFWGSIQTLKHIFKIEKDKIGVVWVCEWVESILYKYILQYRSVSFLMFCFPPSVTIMSPVPFKIVCSVCN